MENAEAERDLALDDVFRGTRVYLAGGSPYEAESLAAAVEDAANDALKRLYPRFGVADDSRWGKVFDQARKGSPAALEVLDFRHPPQDHPVCAAVLKAAGSGKKGSDLVRGFSGHPYGWPRDAINGALAVLVVHGQLRVSRNGQVVDVKALDPRSISSMEFRAEDVVLSASQRVSLRGLFGAAGVRDVKHGEEGFHVREFLKEMRALAARAGGPPPFSAPPSTAHLDEIERRSGNAQLLELYERSNDLTRDMSVWGTRENRIMLRMPAWQDLERALGYAAGLPDVAEVREQAEAIREQRSLLADTNPMDGLFARVIEALRAALKAVRDAYEEAYAREMDALTAAPAWQALDADAQQATLARYGLDHVPAIDVSTPDAVLASLDDLSLGTWRDRLDALPNRFRQALTDAARASEPETRRVRLRSTTLRDAEDVERWIEETREVLLAQVKEGPVIV